MKIVNLAVKIIEQIRMPVIRPKPILFTDRKAKGVVTSAQIILTLQIPFRALFYNYSNIYPSTFSISDRMANLSFQLNTCQEFYLDSASPNTFALATQDWVLHGAVFILFSGLSSLCELSNNHLNNKLVPTNPLHP